MMTAHMRIGMGNIECVDFGSVGMMWGCLNVEGLEVEARVASHASLPYINLQQAPQLNDIIEQTFSFSPNIDIIHINTHLYKST